MPPIRGFGAAWIKTIGIDLLAFAAAAAAAGRQRQLHAAVRAAGAHGAVLGSVSLAWAPRPWPPAAAGDAAWHWLQQPGDSPVALRAGGAHRHRPVRGGPAGARTGARLAREETIAQRNRSTARLHALVNDLVIETLSEGVLVIDAEGPGARGQSGGADDDPRARTHSPARCRSRWKRNRPGRRWPRWRARPSRGKGLVSRKSRWRRLRARRAKCAYAPGSRLPSTAAESLCVMFLQDLRELEARIRTEKLAAMGRMSAAVAHEIRNPLAAITQASALLYEDLGARRSAS
jgi:two-component system sensor histidine kinase PilS (NtrC family)